ncbi:glycosyltransferase [Chromatium okenii]|uniref:glycosyltransferase n=1 Tax=Chromatium okenii TaxID=61644 RepID=UPI0026F251A3|nr:glycosyltransferase [Chromatium okenii]MBV5309721.1 glycosyltransferase [Chromatium okenii]
MTNPRISVCIVTYNHERYIHDCIMSVLAQTRDVSLEILVGDDVSDDNTSLIVGDLALRFPDTIRYYRHEIRLGPAGNYQFLIERSKGEYIAHLDGDDYWLPGKLKAQSKRLDDEPDCPAIYSNALCINDEGCLLGLFNNLQPDRFDLMGLLKRGNFLNHSSMLYRACYRGELLSWTPDFIDYRIHLYLSRFGNIGYLNAPFVGYRINSSGSMVVHQNDKVRLFYWAALCDIPPPLVRPEDLSKGMAEFMRSIFFRSVRIRSMHLLKIWWPRILDQAPAGRARLIAQACWSILRTATTETISILCRRLTGNTMKVLYPR